MRTRWYSVDWKNVAGVVLLGCLVLPWLALVPLAGTAEDQAKLDRIVARVERLADATRNAKMREVLAYTAYKYDHIHPFCVRVYGVPVAGFNVPWCPGLTINREFWDDEDIALQLLVHEAMHDFPPYLCHFHIDGWVAGCHDDEGLTELERLMRDVK